MLKQAKAMSIGDHHIATAVVSSGKRKRIKKRAQQRCYGICVKVLSVFVGKRE